MNVLILAGEFPPEVRSAALLMAELADSMARRGHQVTVITAAAQGARGGSLLSPAIEHRGDVRVIRIPTLAVHRSHAPAVVRGVMQLLNAAAFLVAALRVKDVDVSFAYSPPLALGIVGGLLHKLKGIPHVLNVQDLVPQYAIDLGILRNRTLIGVLKWIERAVYRNVQQITVHSSGNASYMLREGVPPRKVAVVPNWVDTQHIHPGARETRWRHEAGLDGKFVVLFAGALGFAQDLDTVVEAATFLGDRPDIVVAIVGDGVEKQRLQEKAKSLGAGNVRFLPTVTSDGYPEVVASADLCLATLQKTLLCPVVPSKLLGYMAAGRPIVGSFPEGGDAPRVIRDAGCGVSVPAGEPAQLAGAIRAASDNPGECLARGERGRRFVEANHDREQVMALYESIFTGLCIGDVGRGQLAG